MSEINHYSLFFILIFCLFPAAESSPLSNLTSRIQAYTIVAISKEKSEVKAPICSAENIISQMEKELDSMSVTMEKWDELADQHINVKVERFKESLVKRCCPDKAPKKSNEGGSQDERGRGRGRGRRKQQQNELTQ